MATVVDALVIEFGLDPTNFTKGQKEVVAGIKATEDQAARSSKEMDARGKQAAQFFSRVRNEVIALAAVFVGGAGLKSFTEHMTVADAATGRLATNLNMSTQELSAWEQVAERSGATAADMAGAFQSVTSTFQEAMITGQNKLIPMFKQLGIEAVDPTTGKLKSMNEIFLKLAEWSQGKNPAYVQGVFSQIGISPAVGNVLLQGRAALEKKLAEQSQDAVRPEDSAAATKLQEAMKRLQLTFESVGRSILTEVTPALSDLLDTFRQFVEANREEIGKTVKEFIAWIKTVDWKEIGAGIASFAHGVNTAVEAVGGWVTVTKVLFGLWVGSKFAAVLANVLALAAATKTVLGGGAAAAAAGGAGEAAAAGGAGSAALGILAGPAAFIAGMWPKTTNSGEDQFIREHPELFPPPASTEELNGPRVKKPVGRNWLQGLLHGFEQNSTGVHDADVNQLVGLGWSREQALGILANTQAESRGDPTAVGDKGQAYGLQQWHKPRQDAFRRWAGHDIHDSTREEQLAFVDYELRHGEKRAGDALLKTRTAADAASVVSRLYERPKAAAGEAEKRAAIAVALSGTQVPGVDPSLIVGARASVAARQGGGAFNAANNNTNSSEVHINTINVNAPNATDMKDVGKRIGDSLKEYGFAQQAATGLN